MKAVICTKFGLNNLKILEIQKPVPRDDEVLVKVYASSANTSNVAGVTGRPFFSRLFGAGLLKPKIAIPGKDIAGRVESIGRNIIQFKPGDEVFGHSSGAYAEFVSVPQNRLAIKPATVSFEEAAVVPEASLVALRALRDVGHIKMGQKVLIYGASGGIGTFAVQIAKSFGAEVSGVCSTKNLDMVTAIGADHVIDYTKEDFLKNGKLYNLIHGAVGYRSIFEYRRALSHRGIFVATGGSIKSGPMPMAQIFEAMLLGRLISKPGGKKLCFIHLNEIKQKDLIFIKELIDAGKIKPVIDKCYPLQETAEALRYYSEGHSRGKVAITVIHNSRI